MKTKLLIAATMGALMLFNLLAAADYSGDHPLTHYERGGTYGDLVYVTVEDGSAYLTLDSMDLNTMEQDLTIDIPPGATIKTARLYNYYTWSTPDHRDVMDGIGIPAEAKMMFNGEEVICQYHSEDRDLIPNPIDYGNGVVQYWDTKGQDYSSTAYDGPSGTFAWDVTDLIDGSGTYTARITNEDSTPTPCEGICNYGNEAFTTYGFGLLVVYDIEPVGPQPTHRKYWIMEGAEILSATYTETPESATTSASFHANVPNINGIESATLKTVVVSCDKGGLTPPGNMVSFNGMEIGPATAHDRYSIGVDDDSVGGLIKKTGNMVEIQDRGDYMVASNAFLVVEY